MILTVSTSVAVANFRSSPYLIPVIRETISDYALPVGVILWSIFACNSGVVLGSLGIEGFTPLTAATMQTSGKVIGVTFALGFAASILFFMDQNITSQILNAPTNKMKKGGAPHLDILIIGIVNLILSIYGLPWMHAVLPHSPLHVLCLADIEERVIDGQTRQVIVKSRETRLTGIFCHVLMVIVLAACPFIFNYIAYAVLDGLFLYCAVMSLRGNSFVERFLLLFTQQVCNSSDVHEKK
jgi:sodium borate transporter 11